MNSGSQGSSERTSWFDARLTMNNVITIAIVVFSMIGGWFMLAGQVTANTAAMQSVISDVREIDQKVEGVKKDATASEKERLLERLDLTKALADLSADLRYLRKAVDEMRSGQSPGYPGTR